MRTALLIGAFAPLLAADMPQLAVENGTKVTKTFTSSLELELASASMIIDGEEQEMPEGAEMNISDSEEIIFIDEYVEVEDGKAVEIVRSYETLSDVSSQEAPGPPAGELVKEEREGESDLEGRAIRFKWNGDEEDYDVTFATKDDEGDESLLEDLHVDADFLFLLPGDDDEDLGVGDSWELEAAVFDRISNPSGDLKILAEEDDEESDFQEQFKDSLEGTLTATLKSIEDGVATITFEGQIETIVKDDEVPEAQRDQVPDDYEIMQTYSFAFDCEGELKWDMERGVAKSFTFGGAVALDINVEQSALGQTFEVAQQLEGEFEETATFE